MSNRVIKDCISNHPLVAKLTADAQDQFLRWILLADDWGCFNADVDVIKGACYAKRPKITAKIIETLRSEFYETGFLFCWLQHGIIWGSWTWWETGEFAGIISYNEGGERNRNRRRTPEPPAELLSEYLSVHSLVVSHLDATGRSMTQADAIGAVPRSLFPSPSSPNSPFGRVSPQERKTYGKFGHVRLTDAEHADLKAELNGHHADYIDQFDGWVAEAPDAKAGRGGVRRRDRNALATMRNWFRRDLKQGKIQQHQPGGSIFEPN